MRDAVDALLEWPSRTVLARSEEAEVAHNVLGGELRPCSTDPLTGFYRNGCCDTGGEDTGVHTCASG